ncbi:hypothetical protein BLOT_016401, partial [Blomia tropicalis]
ISWNFKSMKAPPNIYSLNFLNRFNLCVAPQLKWSIKNEHLLFCAVVVVRKIDFHRSITNQHHCTATNCTQLYVYTHDGIKPNSINWSMLLFYDQFVIVDNNSSNEKIGVKSIRFYR